MKTIVTLLIGSCLLLFTASTSFGQMYTITDLGPLSPTAINTWGQVVGNLNGHAFMWTKVGGLKDLGTLQGGTFSSATEINDVGTVVGTADGPGVIISNDPTFPNKECDNLVQPFIWMRNVGMRRIGLLGFAGRFYDEWCGFRYFTTDVDVYGRVVGVADAAFVTYEWGFLWTNSDGMSLLADAWQTTANGVNNVGQVVGQTGQWDLTTTSHAAVWNKGLKTDLGTLGGDAWSYCSGANGNNDLDQVVGWSTTTPTYSCYPGIFSFELHAFLWKTGAAMQDLGTLPGDTSSVAKKINFFGQVIGSSGNTAVWQDGVPGGSINVTGRPFIWSARNGMRDLNTLINGNSGWVLNTATDINVWGQIVGSGTRWGQPHGYLLTPKTLFAF